MSSPSSQTQRVARNFTWLSLQETLIRVIGLVTAIYLARTLGPASFGALSLALAIVSIVGTLEAGTGSRATRQTALDPAAVPDIYAQLIGFHLVVAAAAILILLAVAPLLSQVFSFSAALLSLCAFLLLRPALTVAWAFRGLDQMHVNAVADVVEKALTLLALVLLVRGQGNDILWAPVVEVAAGLLLVGLLRGRLSRDYPGLTIEFRTRDWADIAREGMPLGLAALMGSVSLHGSVLLLGWLSTAESAAGFLVAQKIMLTLALVVMVINAAAFPSASRLLAGDSPGALELLASLLRYYMVIITPVFLLVVFNAEALLVLLFGAEYASAGVVLIILLIALPFMALNHSLQLLLRAIPKPRWLLASRIVGTGVLLLLALLFIPRGGMSGAAMAVVGSDIAGTIILLFLVKEATGGLPLNVRCFGPFVAGGAATVAYWISGGSPVFVSLTLAAVAYFLTIMLTRAVTVGELRSLPGLILHIAREPTPRRPAN